MEDIGRTLEEYQTILVYYQYAQVADFHGTIISWTHSLRSGCGCLILTHVQMEFLVVQFVSSAPCPVADHH